MEKLVSFQTAFVLLIGIISTTNACTCMPRHPQQAFRSAHFVIRAVVLSEKNVPFQVKQQSFGPLSGYMPVLAHYDILITRVYKGTDKIESLFGFNKVNKTIAAPIRNARNKKYRAKVYTSGFMASCGIQLRKGGKYLLTGYLGNDKLHVGLCNWISSFEKLTKKESQGIRGDFNSDCNVDACWGGDRQYCKPNDNTCYWDIFYDENIEESCAFKHSICKRQNNKCLWTRETDYADCRAKEILINSLSV